MNKAREIKKLKKKAREYITEYYATSANYDCGLALAEELSYGMRYYKELFNKTMDRLSEIDPDAPDTRL